MVLFLYAYIYNFNIIFNLPIAKVPIKALIRPNVTKHGLSDRRLCVQHDIA